MLTENMDADAIKEMDTVLKTPPGQKPRRVSRGVENLKNLMKTMPQVGAKR